MKDDIEMTEEQVIKEAYSLMITDVLGMIICFCFLFFMTDAPFYIDIVISIALVILVGSLYPQFAGYRKRDLYEAANKIMDRKKD